MNPKYTIAALRELISVRRDSEQALRMCAASLGPAPLRELCGEGAAECADAVRELEALVEQLGGERQGHGAVPGFWRSGWAGLRAALAREDDGAILDACVRETVLRQFEVLMSTHDAIRGCRAQRTARGDAAAATGAQAGQH